MTSDKQTEHPVQGDSYIFYDDDNDDGDDDNDDDDDDDISQSKRASPALLDPFLPGSIVPWEPGTGQWVGIWNVNVAPHFYFLKIRNWKLYKYKKKKKK